MKAKVSFKEYCQSKEYLRLAADNIPQVSESYQLTKYCKFPIIVEDASERGYIAFKPKDTIDVVWEYLDPASPTVKSVTVFTDDEDDVAVHPSWGNTKLASWLIKNTKSCK